MTPLTEAGRRSLIGPFYDAEAKRVWTLQVLAIEAEAAERAVQDRGADPLGIDLSKFDPVWGPPFLPPEPDRGAGPLREAARDVVPLRVTVWLEAA